MAIMRADAQLEGSQALANILAEHVRTDTVSRYRYLVIPPEGPRFNSGLPEAAIGVDDRELVRIAVLRKTLQDEMDRKAQVFRTDESLGEEISQLLYWLQVMMIKRGLSLEDVYRHL